MNRRYTTQQFREIANRLREAYKDVNLTTDIIVGFPGETEEEFERTYQFLKEIKFYKIHVFQYSPRKGTKAATMENQIAPETKEKRSKKIMALSDADEAAYNRQYIGKQVEVLWEEHKQGRLKGHTTNYILVEQENEKLLENTIQKVKIENADIHRIIAKKDICNKNVTNT